MAGLTYKSAGVDIEKGDNFVDTIKKITKNSSIGMFGNVFDVSSLGMQSPVLVSGTDGVGTKLKLAFRLNKHDTIGIDLVAMCVNDVLCHGAKPIYFLDYLAHSNVDIAVLEQVIIGVNEGCKMAGCQLAGGETAEMPGIYHNGEYDLAGFTVGAVEKDNMLPKQTVCKGDILIALPSSGVHSNGFSLVNAVLEKTKESSRELLERLLVPTKIYIQELLECMFNIEGISAKSEYYHKHFGAHKGDKTFGVVISNSSIVKEYGEKYAELAAKSDDNHMADNIKNPGKYNEILRQWVGGASYSNITNIAGINGNNIEITCEDQESQNNILYNIKMRYGQNNNAVKALAHITGGGLYDNTMRVIPQGLHLEIDYASIKTPDVFAWIQQHGNIEKAEMFRVFNMGIGMVGVVSKNMVEEVLSRCNGSYVFGFVK